MNKHTPGPWAVYSEVPSDAGEASYSRYAVCHDDGKSRFPYHHEAVANARLIAAAPDMLAALKIAKRVFERAQEGGDHYEILLAAIRKAEGKHEFAKAERGE